LKFAPARKRGGHGSPAHEATRWRRIGINPAEEACDCVTTLKTFENRAVDRGEAELEKAVLYLFISSGHFA
jgi:hypothetical protein